MSGTFFRYETETKGLLKAFEARQPRGFCGFGAQVTRQFLDKIATWQQFVRMK
jgi:hypothetical protein